MHKALNGHTGQMQILPENVLDILNTVLLPQLCCHTELGKDRFVHYSEKLVELTENIVSTANTALFPDPCVLLCIRFELGAVYINMVHIYRQFFRNALRYIREDIFNASG